MTLTNKFEAKINEAIVQMLMEQIITAIEAHMTNHWNQVITELVHTRKSNIQTEKAFNELVKSNNQITEQLRNITSVRDRNENLQQKEQQILDFLIREFGIRPGERL